jgi:hypothetical protein
MADHMKKLGEPIKMGEDYCPYCNHKVDMASSTSDDGAPKPGDISLCISCAGIMAYGSDMALEEFPKVLFDTLPEDHQKEILRVQDVIRMVNKENHENTRSVL